MSRPIIRTITTSCRSTSAVRAAAALPKTTGGIQRLSLRGAAATPRLVQPFVGVRWKSTDSAQPNSWAKNPIITYDELKPITQQPNDDILLVDVREPDEVALGSIPSSVSLPLSQLRDSLDKNFSPGEFQKNLIFFCRSGKRSATAAEWANEKGYANVRNYQGSWLDWTKKEKERGEDD